MVYKTVVASYNPVADKMASDIENIINDKVKQGWEFVTFSVTNSAKAILVFKVK